MIIIQNTEFKTCHITEIDHERSPLYLIRHNRSGIGAVLNHDETVLQVVADALHEGDLYSDKGNLYLKWPNKSIKLNEFLHQIYHNIALKPAEQIKYIKDTPYLQDGVFDFTSLNLRVLGRDKIPHTESRDVDIVTIGNRQYVRVWMKKYNRIFYCDALPETYDLLVDTRLCYLVSNHGKIQVSINSEKYIPHMGQVSLAAYEGKLTDNNLNQAKEILNQLTNNQ